MRDASGAALFRLEDRWASASAPISVCPADPDAKRAAGGTSPKNMTDHFHQRLSTTGAVCRS